MTMQSGRLKMGWARQYMPVLASIRKVFEEEQPLSGMTIGMALHVEAKTAVLVETLAAGGAEVHITGCNPLSTQDDVADALNGRSLLCDEGMQHRRVLRRNRPGTRCGPCCYD
jgi:adenosylhomocysteinase